MAKNIPQTDSHDNLPKASRAEVSHFLRRAESLRVPKEGNGGLIFALDATMSRQQTWDQAQKIQAEMFNCVVQSGGLDVQLVYFRGFGECRASKWVNNAGNLRELMTGIKCLGGETQIGKVLSHARKQVAKKNPINPDRSRVSALVFVGDAMEENIDQLCGRAGQLGLLGVPCFMFLEGHDRNALRAFKEIVRLSNGAFMRFDENAASSLSELLKAVAAYVTGGLQALEKMNSRAGNSLLEQLK